MVHITGDTHGNFRRLQYFCEYAKTTKDDILVVLGDAGINIYGELTKRQIELLPFDDLIDTKIKSELQQLPITLLCIHGNHDSWYCGHFHTDNQKGKIQFVFKRFLENKT